MKKIITTALLAGSLMSIFGITALSAEESQNDAIDQKARMIVHEAKEKADKLVEDAMAKAKILIEKAKIDTAELKKESAESMKETTEEAKALANEAMEKSKTKSHELVEKTKTLPQAVQRGIENNYVYTKKTVNKSYQKGKVTISDTRIHAAIKYAFLMCKDIHSMKIDVDVKDGVVELLGKVKSHEEADKAMQIALSIKGVWAVKALFFIEE